MFQKESMPSSAGLQHSNQISALPRIGGPQVDKDHGKRDLGFGLEIRAPPVTRSGSNTDVPNALTKPDESQQWMEPFPQGEAEEKSQLGVCTSCRTLLNQVYHHCFDCARDDEGNSGTLNEGDPSSLMNGAQKLLKSTSPKFLQMLSPLSEENTKKSLHGGLAQASFVKEIPAKTLHALESLPPESIFADPVKQNAIATATHRERKRDGLLKKFSISLKDNEISHLRTYLHQELSKTTHSKEIITLLRENLRNVLGYAANAQEWQKKETNRLLHNVEDLQENLAALMVMYIHSEEDKSKV
jgi:hypothetical protein